MARLVTAPGEPWHHAPEPEPPDLDDLTPPPCACCGWHDWWRNPDCVQSQPPEFVIDDARPGVLRAPRPDDFRTRGVALLADAGRAGAGRCRCSRHDQESAGAMATAMNAGFGMPLPEHVTTCTEPDRPNDPDVQRFWREVDF